MLRFVVRTVLTALVLTYVLPQVGGAHFNGAFWPEGVVFALLLAATAYALGLLTVFATVLTAGVAALFVGLFLLFGFWLVPAIELRVLAHFFPAHLGFTGWGPAIVVGLVLLVVNCATATRRKSS